jgi:class 3 adenylate cyclase/tetratricopeptide (TPR) repeat protein
VRCSVCGTENEAGRKFCQECGSALARPCPTCGSPNAPAAKFCGECGTALAEPAEAPAPGPRSRREPAIAERRLVTILFADLVGFTTLSESRDPEDVRDLLTRYFEATGRIVERYGGIVEKFIGDAVMAVWGTPVANEDDAERAVRAALDLTAAVAALGLEVGAPDLKARTGVLTGEAAVTLGAQGQGMVAGDLVNTAARIQSAADPGTVLAGETTMRATEAAVVYEDAGLHELKGKTEPVRLWLARRVVALRGGALKSTGLEAPFVGREREFGLVKDLFHASADQGRAHLVSVWGIAGIGKSRLSWEFFKYIDGLAGTVRWHRGRCLPYGEGVTFWALAEMVRSRAGIAEGEDPASAGEKLHAAVIQHVPDPEDQRWIEPRLAHLLGLEERSTRQPEELFSAWRLFFEQLAQQNPVVMVFEDLQWADAALLDFVEYLLEWSRNHPLFVMTLARPEMQDRHPGWGAGKRNLTSLALEPLPAEAMEALLAGLVPGLPDDVQAAILERSEGVPIYAVETVRMLIDRGLLVREGTGYRPAGPIPALEVPDSLHALIAARLDGLTPEERRLVQDAAVLGKTFTTEAVAALRGDSSEEVGAMLASLQRKEVLGFQSDPRSPERGQYGFLQDLVKRVAYETLSRRDRKALHLAAARYLEGSWTGEQEDVVEIVAHHYTQAYQAAPDAPDATELRTSARNALIRAGERAASLAANEEAQGYFDRALELADDPADQATIAERAGEMAAAAARKDAARERFDRAIERFNAAGLSHAAARVSAKLAELLWLQFIRIDEAVELMESSLAVLAGDEPDQDVAALMAQAGRLHYFRGELDEAGRWTDSALVAAEAQLYPWVLSQALNTKSLILRARGRSEEARALLRHALYLAEEHDIPDALSRALFNLADELANRDEFQQALELDLRNRELARLIGDQTAIGMAQIHLVFDYMGLGRWDAVMELLAAVPLPEDAPEQEPVVVFMHSGAINVLVNRGELDEAERVLRALERLADPSDFQDRLFRHMARSIIHKARGRLEEALSEAEESLLTKEGLGFRAMAFPLTHTIDVAIDLGREERAEELLGWAESAAPSEVSHFLRAQVSRLRGRLAARAGHHEEAEGKFKAAQASFQDRANAFWIAVTALQRAEALLAAGRSSEAEPLLEEARDLFVGLSAAPWIDRVDHARRADSPVRVVPA